MTTDKIIDEIMDDIKNYQITHIADEDISWVRNTIDKILEHIVRPTLTKHLHQEPAKEWREWKCKICWKEWMYLETDNMMCDSCWDKQSEHCGWMLQPWEYMRDNEWNITTYEDEQKLSG